jgi:hypothetical protein
MVDLVEYMKGLKRSKRTDDIPGTVEKILEEEICPSCKKSLRIYKPCCGSPKGYKGCAACGYKIQL